MLIDLHVHSDISPCSNMALDEIVAMAPEKGLDGVCITDHDTMEAKSSLREGIQDNGLIVIIGMEYSTPQGDFLVFGPFEHLRPGMTAPELLPLVRNKGGVCIGAHPFRVNRPSVPSMFAPGLCEIVEIANGRNTWQDNSQAHELAQERKLAMSAGSDAHRIDELGTYPTDIFASVKSRDDLITALRCGRFRPSGRALAAGLQRIDQAS